MRGCIAILLFLIIVAPIIFAAEVLAATETWLAQPDFYVDVLDDQDIYAALLEIGVTQLSGPNMTFSPERQYADLLRDVDRAQWRAVVQNVIVQVYELLEGRSTRLWINIPLTPVRDVLAGEHGMAFIGDYVRSLPVCGTSEHPLSRVAAHALPLPACRPSDVDAGQLTDELTSRIPAILAAMPAEMSFGGEVPDELIDQFRILLMPAYAPIIRIVTFAVGGLALVLWVLVAFIGGEGLRGRLVWLGGMLILPSLGVLSLGLLLVIMGSGGLLMPTDVGYAGQESRNLTLAISALMLNATSLASMGYVWAGGVSVAFALLLMLISLVIPASRRAQVTDDVFTNPTVRFAGDDELGNFSQPQDKPKNDIIRPL